MFSAHAAGSNELQCNEDPVHHMKKTLKMQTLKSHILLVEENEYFTCVGENMI